jgi:cellulose synthase/poly-beta-1,6-N-acetylglucosamine synthase-like glycosyltransferase
VRLSYSVVVTVDRPDKRLLSLQSLALLPKREKPREIFLSVGKNPSLQRNVGVGLCKSPLVYFLDDDSFVNADTPSHLTRHFENPRTAVAGGPNLVFPQAPAFEKTVSAVLASWMGSFKVRNRYAALGSVKEATEKDLILCNLMVRREAFEKKGGFRTDLYPNEENEFLNRLLHDGAQLIYNPQAAIYRPRRKNVKEFSRQAFRYGQGRARQIKIYPCLSDAVHLIPAFFTLYTLSLLAGLLPGAPHLLASALWRAPFALFLALCLGTSISALSWHRNPLDLFLVPALIFLRQFLYGVGLFVGFLTSSPQRSDLPVRCYQVRFKGKTYRLFEIKPKGKKKK